MTTKRYNPEIHHRHTIRLRGYDYSSTGMYFVTICVEGHEHMFGKIDNGAMVMNEAGNMVEKWWNKIPEKFHLVEIDTHVVMPNHFHGIIRIDSNDVGAPPRGCPNFQNFDVAGKTGRPHGAEQEGRPHGAAPTTLGDMMDWFKTMTTNAYIRGVKQSNWPPFPGRLWQRNYYERIIRDERELNNIRDYIVNNPARWEEDPENRRIIADESIKP